MQLQELEQRVENHTREVQLLDGKHQELKRQYTSICLEIETLTEEIQVLELTVVLFDQMLKDLVESSLDKIKALVTAGLKAIFTDQKLALSLELGMDRKQPSLNFFLEDEVHEIRAPIRGNFGGGPVAVADMLLRVICILKMDLARIMILDEAMSQVSASYLPNAGEFMQKLCSSLGMTILLITHSDFRGSADKVYRASLVNGALMLELEKDKDSP